MKYGTIVKRRDIIIMAIGQVADGNEDGITVEEMNFLVIGGEWIGITVVNPDSAPEHIYPQGKTCWLEIDSLNEVVSE